MQPVTVASLIFVLKVLAGSTGILACSPGKNTAGRDACAPWGVLDFEPSDLLLD